MSQRPTTFGQLLHRLTSRGADAFQNHGPLIATATEVAEPSDADKSPLRVILHRITIQTCG